MAVEQEVEGATIGKPELALESRRFGVESINTNEPFG
jgi:hypothetical protein